MQIQVSAKQIQKQILAPSMQQSIEVLLLPLIDLSMAVDQELQSNPLLEVEEDNQEQINTILENALRKQLDIAQQDQGLSYIGHPNDDEIIEDKPIKMEECLEDQLLRQLRIEISDPTQLKIGELIIGNLDEDGYLQTSLEEIAQFAVIEDLSLIEEVLSIIQSFDPLGIASRNLSECLLTQLKANPHTNNTLIIQIIQDHLNDLGKKKYLDIARKLKIPLDQVKEVAKTIASLEPKPARNLRPIKGNIYVKPDVAITKDENDNYQIHVNDDGVPTLRINNFYRNLLINNKLNTEEITFLKEKLKNAIQFIKSVEQRGQTIKKITEYILEKQRDFFDYGHMALAPMTLRDVAQTIDRNESTISRAISHKYIDTPRGTLPLKFFFSGGIQEDENGTVASRSVKEEIRNLIDDENKSRPMSDQDLHKHFEEKGMHIARRTISKYRQALKILPSHLRKE